MEKTQKETKELDFQKAAYEVSIVTLIGNVILSAFKLFAGVVAHSNAMISDAMHSASDVFSTFVVMIGIKLATKDSDKEHPYGHERMECVAAILLSVVLFLTGLMIGWEAMKNIVQRNAASIEIPGMLALVAAILSILSKEAMYWYTRHYAIKIDSSALMADAWHHRSDAFSSVGALIGIAGARLGYPVLDSVASLVIFFFIVKAAWDIFADAINKVVDHSCDDATEKEIYNCIIEEKIISSVDMLHTRIFGNRIYVDVEIGLNPAYSLQEAHDIAHMLHDKLERTFPKVKHVMVHVNPVEM